MISTGPPVIMKLRDSRHIRSIGISVAVPRAPWNCMQRSAASKPSSVQKILVMNVSWRSSTPVSNFHAVR